MDKILSKSNVKYCNSTGRKRNTSIVLTIMLFLYCINFYPTVIVILISPFIVLNYFFMSKERIKFNLYLFSLILFTILYTVISVKYGYFSLSSATSFVILPVSLYLIKKEGNDRSFIYYIYVAVFSLFVFGILSVVKTIYYDGFSTLLNLRIVYTFWNNTRINATNLGAYFTMGLSLVGFLFTFQEKVHIRGIKFISIIIITLSIAAEFFLGNRTGLVIIVTSFIAVYSVLIFFDTSQRRYKLFYTFIVFITVLLVIYRIKANIWGIGERILGSSLVIRLFESNLFEDLRFKAWEDAFIGLFKYPLGGKQAYITLNYAHNLCLDVGYATGVIPFIILLVFTFLTFIDFVKLIKNRETSIELKTILSGVYASLFVNFFVEPILEGYFTHFTIFCFIAGMTNKYVRITNSLAVQESIKRGVVKNEGSLVC